MFIYVSDLEPEEQRRIKAGGETVHEPGLHYLGRTMCGISSSGRRVYVGGLAVGEFAKECGNCRRAIERAVRDGDF